MGVSAPSSPTQLSMRTASILLAICLVVAAQAQTTPPPKEARAKAPSILCGTNTHRIINVGPNTNSVFKTQRNTRRCTLIYKVNSGNTDMFLMHRLVDWQLQRIHSH